MPSVTNGAWEPTVEEFSFRSIPSYLETSCSANLFPCWFSSIFSKKIQLFRILQDLVCLDSDPEISRSLNFANHSGKHNHISDMKGEHICFSSPSQRESELVFPGDNNRILKLSFGRQTMRFENFVRPKSVSKRNMLNADFSFLEGAGLTKTTKEHTPYHLPTGWNAFPEISLPTPWIGENAV